MQAISGDDKQYGLTPTGQVVLLFQMIRDCAAGMGNEDRRKLGQLLKKYGEEYDRED